MSEQGVDVDKALLDLKLRRSLHPAKTDEERMIYDREYQSLYRLKKNPNIVRRPNRSLQVSDTRDDNPRD